MLTGSEIRRKFLDFFVQKGHKEVHSSSLVPANDPTLLFTNAGMNQFKDVFLGLEKRDYSRATTSQKCVRAGGKHNDLENVGFTNRHHTFFEMLGNFSFGDYFKKNAIAYAWELVTSPEWFGIDKNKLYATIFKGEAGVARDAEAYDLWAAQGVPKDRIYEMGLKDNFWQMGDTGPCGPCSEIYYDMGPAASDQGHTNCAFGCDCGRYVEIWNLVFMQFDRDASGKLTPLPKPSIDTGMGLERTAAVLQGVISNYDTDLFTPLIKRAAELTGTSLQKELSKEAHTKSAASLRVIADHSRAATFLISDGVLPSNEGRGYVLRKITRRAITHGRLLGQTKPFLHEMVFTVRDLMCDAYPELRETAERVSKIVRTEEERFAHTLAPGLKLLGDTTSEALENIASKHVADAGLIRTHLEQASQFALEAAGKSTGSSVLKFHGNIVESFSHEMKAIGDDLAATAKRGFEGPKLVQFLQPVTEKIHHAFESPSTLSEEERRKAFVGLRSALAATATAARIGWFPGDAAFKLYDTFGVPPDFIHDAVRDQGLVFDHPGFDLAMEEQKSRARASWKGAAKQTANPAYQQLPKSEFEGYRQTRSDGCQVLAIIHNGQGVRELKAGEEGEVILDHTPFYAEAGGQVGDRGWLYSDDHNTVVAEVKGCYYPIQGVRAHQIVTKSPIRVGDKVDAVVNTDIRESTMRNHTATHLLHAGLREVLGKHVKQAGSLVAPNHLRFDFSHFTAVEDEELQDIEDIINKEVLRDRKVETIADVPIDVAINEYHAMALFGEKYGDKVRVIRIGDFSTELCGGTHTGATGEIGLIKILKEGSVSSGVRRVEAITGEGSLHHFRRDHQLENVVSSFVATHPSKITKGGAPSADVDSDGERTFSPAEALKAELEKKDAEIKRLARELDQARMKSASSATANVGEKVKEIKGVKVLAQRVDNLERAQLRTLVDQLRDKIGSGVVVLGSASNGNVALIVGVTKDLTGRVQAGKVIGPVAQKIGGKGGGRPDLAEAGGKDASALDAALDGAYGVVEGLLP
ncbi:MAG TPA: alanine--tRNA ligase [Candidatus Sulfotelmatobacter sp.]|nr:alanine--tRNA ligase [Candidatus Sulfotelmatobacter sp.]